MKPAWPKLKMPVVPMFSWIPSANTPYVVASTPTLIQKSSFVEELERDAQEGGGRHRSTLLARPNRPCGRISSTTISTANPTATFIEGSMTSVDHSCATPISIPPASAPYALPIPPTTTAAKMLRISVNPSWGFTVPAGSA